MNKEGIIEDDKKEEEKPKSKKKVIFVLLLSMVVVGGIFFLANMGEQTITELFPREKEQQSHSSLFDTNEKGYVELLVKTSDNVGTNDITEERAGNSKQGYIVQVKPSGWLWGTNELDPLRFAIIRIPIGEWNASWLKPEYNYSHPLYENDEDEKEITGYQVLTQRRYKLPLETFINSTKLDELKNKTYNEGWEEEVAILKDEKLSSSDFIVNETGIWNITLERYIDEKEIYYSIQQDLAIAINLPSIKENITEVNYDSNEIDWKAHGSAGLFTVCIDPSSPHACNYSSLSAWESDQEANLTGAGPCIANITGEWATNDSTAVTLNGWSTTSDDYIKIVASEETRALKTEWDTTRYRLEVVDAGSGMFTIYEDYVKLDGLQLRHTYSEDNYDFTVLITLISANNNVLIDSCRIESTGAGGTYINIRTDDPDLNLDIINSIIGPSTGEGIHVYNSNVIQIYNNIFGNVPSDVIEIDATATSVTIKNNGFPICGDDLQDDWGSTVVDYNIASDVDMQGTNGAGPLDADWTKEYSGYATNNFTLTSGGNAENGGTDNLGSGLYLIDMEGETRTSPWDIGVDEYNYPSQINFTNPTPSNDSIVSVDSVFVNVSINDTDDYSAFIDWDRSLVGWWSFDSVSGTTIYDNSTWGNDGGGGGGLSANNVTTDGIRGDAMEFGGYSDFIQIDSPSNEPKEEITVSAWVKQNEFIETVAVVQDRRWASAGYVNFQMFFTTSSWYFGISNGSSQYNAGTAHGSDTGWHHIVGVWNRTTSLIYTDGILKATSPSSVALDSLTLSGAADYWRITTSGNTFNGSIDEVMIFSRALTPEEINASYNAGTYKLYNNFTNLADGEYNYTAWVIDSAGNINSTEQREVTVSTVVGDADPTIVIGSPLNQTYNTPINFSITATDDGTIDDCWFTVNSGASNVSLINSTSNDVYNYTAPTVYSDGGYFTEYYCNDTNGNLNGTEKVSFNIDTTNPLLNITNPINNTNWTINTIDINYTASDVGSPLETCWYSNDTYDVNVTLADCSTNITDVIWGEGQHNVTIWVNDTMGYENSSTIFFTIDTIQPTIQIVFPTNNTNTTNVNLDVNYTASDTNLFNCWYSNDTYSVNTSLTDCGTNITDITWSEGMHNVTIWSNDTFGNVNNDKISFTIDLTPPSIQIVFPTNNTNTSNSGIDVNYSVYNEPSGCYYSNNSGLNNYTLTNCGNITAVTWSEGINNVTIWANDSVGNVNQSYVTFTVDTTNPEINIFHPINNTNWTINTIDVNYTASDIRLSDCWYSNNSGLINVSWGCNNITNVTWSEGTNNISLWANDSVGNVNQSYVTFRVDTNAPTITITTPLNNTNSSNYDLNVNFTRSDDFAVEGCWWSDDDGATNTSNLLCENLTSIGGWVAGFNTVVVWVNDTAGNEARDEISFIIDSTNPEINIFHPTNNTNWTINTIDVNYTASDTYLTSCWYSNNSGLNNYTLTNCVNITEVIWSEGTNNVSLWVNDSAGNTNQDYVTFNIDTINPSLNITHPINNTEYSNVNLDVNYTTSDTNLFNCWYSNDSYSVNTSLTDCGTNITTIIWTLGNHNVTIWANDTFGNVNSSRITFNITSGDVTPPTISVIFPINNTNHSINTIDVNYTTSDETALHSCWYSNDTYSVNTSLASCSTNITTIIWTEGMHNVTIWSNDTSGNINDAKVSFIIDTLAPYFNEILLNQTYVENVSVGYDVNATDSGIGLESYSVNDSDFEINSTGWLSNATSLISQQYWVNISINDSVGNMNSSVILINITGIPDKTIPHIQIVFPTNNTNSTNSGLDINYTVSDETALDSCWYSNNTGLNNYTLTSCVNITTVTWGLGQNNVTIWANDSSDNTNYSMVTFNISTVADTTPPTFTNLQNHTHNTNTSFSFDLNANDNVAIDSFILNQTTNFTIDINTGVITNLTDMNLIEIYWLNVTANDTSNNLVSGIFFISVVVPAPTMPTYPCANGLSVLYDNPKIPHIRSWGC